MRTSGAYGVMGLDDFGRRGSREHLPKNKIIQLLAPTTRAATSRRASAHVEGVLVDEEKPALPASSDDYLNRQGGTPRSHGGRPRGGPAHSMRPLAVLPLAGPARLWQECRQPPPVHLPTSPPPTSTATTRECVVARVQWPK